MSGYPNTDPEGMGWVESYPTEEELDRIKTWDPMDLKGLLDYILPRWNYSDVGYWEQTGTVYHLHTGGWSGNEEIIGAMWENHTWWALYWSQSHRGGHYIFSKRMGEHDESNV